MASWLFIMGSAYNVEPLRTKDVPFLDVLTESVNNMIRLLLGWFVLTDNCLPPCSIIIGYWMAGAFLMAIKRFAEYRMIGDPERAGLYRKSFRRYTESSLLVSSFVYALASTFLIGVFLVKHRIELLVSMPFMIALFGKYVAIAYKPDSAAQKPEKLYRERGLMALTFLFVLSILVGSFISIPGLGVFATRDLIMLR
jgi:4-hydroxybenzoate polyprenyltransferase